MMASTSAMRWYTVLGGIWWIGSANLGPKLRSVCISLGIATFVALSSAFSLNVGQRLLVVWVGVSKRFNFWCVVRSA